VALLKIEEVNVFYGELKVLEDISLSVNKGEVATLLGPNGAGKTTLCKTIIGTIHPKSGSIIFDGRRVERLQPSAIIKCGIAIVPEGRRLFGNLTVKENLELGAYVLDKKDDFDDVLEWIFTLFPILKQRQKQLAGSLSGGEQQMLAIARALVSKPKFLILDEPSLGLAPKMVLTVYELLKKIRDENVTMLLVEQYADQALKISDKGFVIEHGRIVTSGESIDLLKNEQVKKIYLGEI